MELPLKTPIAIRAKALDKLLLDIIILSLILYLLGQSDSNDK